MKPVLKFITALIDVTVDKPEGDVDQGCAKDASKNKGDNEIGGRHDRQCRTMRSKLTQGISTKDKSTRKATRPGSENSAIQINRVI
jgi:hypothetical protein